MGNIRILAICGGSGSGKSTIVDYLVEKIGVQNAVVLTMDHYYKDLSHMTPKERQTVNFDSPEALDLEVLARHIAVLKTGTSIERPTYCFKSHTRLDETVEFAPKKFVLLDGILSIHDARIRELIDTSVYVDVAADLRFIRRLQRDVRERGRSVDGVVDQYLQTVRDMYEKYVAPQKTTAQFTIDWTDYNYSSVDDVIESLNVQD